MAKRSKPATTPFRAQKARLKRLRAVLAGDCVDSLLISNPNDIRYLTGFSGEDSFAIVTPKSFIVISDFRFNEQLDAITPIARVVLRDGLMHETVMKLVKELGLEEIGFQSEHMTVAHRALYSKHLKGTKFVVTKGILDGLRKVKDEEEIANIRKAVRIQQKALEQTLDEIGPGMAESRIAAILEFNMKALGSEGTGFSTIAAAKSNSAVPHAVSGSNKTAKGKPLLIDFGAIVNGYRSDMTRVVTFGKWSPKMLEIYEIVRQAHKAAAKALKPGEKCRDVDAAARDLIAGAGYADAFGHGTGHGLGLDIHEAPRLSKHSDEVLEPGMVVTVEPGIYLVGTGGVRLEDDYVVTETGAKNLCTLPMTLEWATR